MVQQTILNEAFEIVRMLSRGGTSEVLEARDRGRRRVAIKLLNASLTRDPELVARFKREARAASSLTSPHVVRVLEIGTTETKRPFLVMEFLVGRDLGTELAVRGSIPLPEAASYLSHACKAMIEAHAAGIVHRDLKPSNLFLAEERGKRVLKVLDFGIAKLQRVTTDGQLTDSRALFGSPLYMSPEMFRSAKVADARSDVWSLGVLFYEMLTGVRPFEGQTPLEIGACVTRSAHVPPASRQPSLPRAVDVVIARALKKEPAERYQSMRELLAAIEVFLPAEGDVVDASRSARRSGGARPEDGPGGTPTRSYPPVDEGLNDRITARPPPPAGADAPEPGAHVEGPEPREAIVSSPPEMAETSRGFGLASDSTPPRPTSPGRRRSRVLFAAPLGAAAAVVALWMGLRSPAHAPAAASSVDAPAAPPAEVEAPPVAAQPAPTGTAEAIAPIETAAPKEQAIPKPKKGAPPRAPKRRYAPTKI